MFNQDVMTYRLTGLAIQVRVNSIEVTLEVTPQNAASSGRICERAGIQPKGWLCAGTVLRGVKADSAPNLLCLVPDS